MTGGVGVSWHKLAGCERGGYEKMIFTGAVKPCLFQINHVWVFRGKVPEPLTQVRTNSIFQQYIDSKTFYSRAEAVKAANDNGLTEFAIFE